MYIYVVLCTHLRPYGRYKSKFKERVKDEYTSRHVERKTMGPAKVAANTVDNFLKRHEKEPVLPTSMPFMHIIGTFHLLHYNSVDVIGR